jgi:hypothetical protein
MFHRQTLVTLYRVIPEEKARAIQKTEGKCEEIYPISAREYNWATLFLGGNKYRNLVLQVGGVSEIETI